MAYDAERRQSRYLVLYDHDFELLWTAINGPGPRERVQFFNFFGRPQDINLQRCINLQRKTKFMQKLVLSKKANLKPCEVCGGRATRDCFNAEQWHVHPRRELVVVTGLPKKTRMTAAELAEILEPIAYPPIGRPLHIEPRARGTAYIDFGDAQTADHVAEQLDQAHLPNGAGKIEAKREKGGGDLS